MRVTLWILRVVFFLLLLGFAVKNSDPVTLRFFFDAHWQMPLVLAMLIFFGAGVLVGFTGALGTLFRQRREIGRLKRGSPVPTDAPSAPALPSVPPQA
jgi:putative membrane protein